MTVTLVSLPEELIERVFNDVFATSSSTYPPWRPARAPLYSPLLTCKLIHRVSAPLFYRSITLQSPAQTVRLATALQSNPALAGLVWEIVLAGVWEDGMSEVLQSCPSLKALDLVLDDGWRGKDWGTGNKFELFRYGSNFVARGVNAVEVTGFCDALGHIRDLRRLTIRKDAHSYLTQLGPAAILHYIGLHIMRWTSLEHVEIAFRYTNGSSLPLNVSYAEYITFETNEDPPPTLPVALSQSPNLKIITTIMPAVWNDALLQISANPSLQEIRMIAAPSPPSAPAPLQVILPTALYYKEASAYPRLIKLINAGSQVLSFSNPVLQVPGRGRAKTFDSPPLATKAEDDIRDMEAARGNCILTIPLRGKARRSSAV